MKRIKKELLKVEKEKKFIEIPLLDYIYVIPTKRIHDSGYMEMEIIGVNEEGYKKKLATYCDVLDACKIITNKKQLCTISMDIPEYGVLRFFSHENKFKIKKYGIGSFEFDLVEKVEE